MNLDAFLIRAALAGLLLLLAAVPLGCFVVWRRMAYFGDATGHGALLGVALALTLSVPLGVGTLAVALAVAGLLLLLMRTGASADTVLGVLSHGTLALGLMAVSLTPLRGTSLEALLFGDILAVGWGAVAGIGLGGAVVAGLIAWRWQPLVTATLDPDFARAAGLRPARDDALLIVTLAVTVAIGLKVVGALLIVAMMILPPAAAQPLSRTPEEMLAGAAAVGIVSVLGGLALSLGIDTPAGASMVSVAFGLFAVAHVISALRR